MKTLNPPRPATLNAEQRLFVIPCGSGYSCLGFDVCHEWTAKIAAELKRPDLAPVESERGTLAGYARHESACEAARLSPFRLSCMLTPQFIGLEGRWVEVEHADGQKRRFIVGKSTGWLPIHLEIARRNSSGGGGVYGAPFKSVRAL